METGYPCDMLSLQKLDFGSKILITLKIFEIPCPLGIMDGQVFALLCPKIDFSEKEAVVTLLEEAIQKHHILFHKHPVPTIVFFYSPYLIFLFTCIQRWIKEAILKDFKNLLAEVVCAVPTIFPSYSKATINPIDFIYLFIF
jgi:hypothetical protein